MTYEISPPIDYRLLSEAVDFYKGLGYQYIEVPWIVKSVIASLTLKDRSRAYIVDSHTTIGELVGSAEQGFIDQFIKGVIPSGKKVVSVSPCFRKEPECDEYHFNQFIKVELGMGFFISSFMDEVQLHTTIDNSIRTFINHANAFFDSKTDKLVECVEVNGDFDLMIDDIELGSYGYRVFQRQDAIIWIYGTGLALPRFSQAIDAIPRSIDISTDDAGSPSRFLP